MVRSLISGIIHQIPYVFQLKLVPATSAALQWFVWPLALSALDPPNLRLTLWIWVWHPPIDNPVVYLSGLASKWWTWKSIIVFPEKISTFLFFFCIYLELPKPLKWSVHFESFRFPVDWPLHSWPVASVPYSNVTSMSTWISMYDNDW